jgi:hypothetical protein
LGLVEIAYNLPEENYVSAYDGLKFVRVTELGRYVFGWSKKMPKLKVNSAGKAVFSDKYLTVKVVGDDPVLALMIDQMCECVGHRRYRLSDSSVVKGCGTEEQLKVKVEGFLNKFEDKLPDNWKVKLNSVLAKVNPLRIDEGKEFVVFKVADSVELRRLFVEDWYLRNYCIRCEGGRVLIEKEDVSIVKKHLGELGYFCE